MVYYVTRNSDSYFVEFAGTDSYIDEAYIIYHFGKLPVYIGTEEECIKYADKQNKYEIYHTTYDYLKNHGIEIILNANT